MLLTGNGPSPKDGGWAFSSGGDQRIRGSDGYKYEGEEGQADPARLGRLHILEVQRLIRFMPKIVIAVVPGWAAGGGHSLHVVCDLTLASKEHGRFKQTDPDVASFDSGYGSAYLARMVGQKRAREIFFLGFDYTADYDWTLQSGSTPSWGTGPSSDNSRRPACPRCSTRTLSGSQSFVKESTCVRSRSKLPSKMIVGTPGATSLVSAPAPLHGQVSDPSGKWWLLCKE